MSYPGVPKFKSECPYTRSRGRSEIVQRGEDTDTQRGRRCENRGRDWSDVATSPKLPGQSLGSGRYKEWILSSAPEG